MEAASKKGFSLSASAVKRGGEQAAGAAAPKIPKVRETSEGSRFFILLAHAFSPSPHPRTSGPFGRMKKLETSPAQNVSRPQSNAPVNICVYKATDSSGDVWPQFPDTKLWQVQLDHDARPSGSQC